MINEVGVFHISHTLVVCRESRSSINVLSFIKMFFNIILCAGASTQIPTFLWLFLVIEMNFMPSNLEDLLHFHNDLTFRILQRSHILQCYTSFMYSTFSVQTWTPPPCFALHTMGWASPFHQIWQMNVFLQPNTKWSVFAEIFPLAAEGNNITITLPREGLRCRAKVGLLFCEEKRGTEWWIMILPKPDGRLRLGGGSLGNLGSLFYIKWVISETYSAVVRNRNVWILGISW